MIPGNGVGGVVAAVGEAPRRFGTAYRPPAAAAATPSASRCRPPG